tara:strand:- start:9 stop:500 length:492 start_codon:yes stop_codon:yes gene_type:complete
MKIQPGVGYTFDSSSSGFTIDASDPFPSVELRNAIVPLTPSIAEDVVSIFPGLVNRYIPTIDGEYIDKTPRPTLTITAAGYILAKATYVPDTFFPRNAEIIFEEGDTPPEDTDSESYYPLAYVASIEGSSPASYSLTIFVQGNLVVNRLKAGASIATWWWSPA